MRRKYFILALTLMQALNILGSELTSTPFEDRKKLLLATGGTLVAGTILYNYLKTGGHQTTGSVSAQFPFVFHPRYDISFFGVEKLHPFDARKYGKVACEINRTLNPDNKMKFHEPAHEVATSDLLKVHSQEYLNSLQSSLTIDSITEIPVVRLLPNSLVQWRLLSPMRYATQGTIDAAFLALRSGVGINLGGGYHHAKKDSGEGFCVYADIPLAIAKLRESNPNLKVMYIDLDAHQGDGVESFLVGDPNAYVVDCFNERNYPHDKVGVADKIDKKLISRDIYCDKHKMTFRRPGFVCQGCNSQYLGVVNKAIDEAFVEYTPDIVFYNAGTDCYENDPIGMMALSEEGIIARDRAVFEKVRFYETAICMTLSGGYSPESAGIIAKSIINLSQRDLLKPTGDYAYL